MRTPKTTTGARWALLSAAALLVRVSAGYPLQYCEAPLPEYVPIDESQYRLAQVTLVTRHGDRSPLTLMADESDVTWDKCDYKEYQVPENDKSVSYQKVVIPPYEYAPKVHTLHAHHTQYTCTYIHIHLHKT